MIKELTLWDVRVIFTKIEFQTQGPLNLLMVSPLWKVSVISLQKFSYCVVSCCSISMALLL